MTLQQHIVLLIGIAFCNVLIAQEDRKLILDGNEAYRSGKYDAAEQNYRSSLEKNSKSVEANFNLGDALFRQEKYEEAASKFEHVAKSTSDRKLQASAYHNLGNSLLYQKKLEESIDAYKEALRLNPKDDATRYNLSYALKMLQQQQEQEQQKNQNQDQENQDNKDQEQNKDNKENQDKQDNQDKQENQDQKNDQDKNEQEQKQEQEKQKQQEQEKQQQEQQMNQLSKEDAERMLESLENEEKRIQQKLNKLKGTGKKVEIEKDW